MTDTELSSLSDPEQALAPEASAATVPANVSKASPRGTVAHRAGARPEGLRKAVEAVLIFPKEGKLTLLVKRFFNVLLKHAQANPVPDDQYPQITLGQFSKDAKYTSRDMEYLVDVLKTMLSIVVTWGDSPKSMSGPKFTLEAASLLSYIKVSKETDGPTVLEYDFHKKLRPLLLNPKFYAYITLEMNAKMSTSASLSLYEVCTRYKTNKDGLTPRLPWLEWAKALTGNPDLSPTLQYKYFARDTLRPAMNEVNDSQEEFVVEVLEGKVGRKVSTLQFVVKPREATPSAQRKPANLEMQELAVVGRMINLGVTQKTAEKFLQTYGLEHVAHVLAMAEKNIAKIENVGGYMHTVLKNGKFLPDEAPRPNAASSTPTPPSSAATGPQPIPDVVDVNARVVKTLPAEALTASLLKAYQEELKKQAFAVFQEGNELDQLELIEQFERERLDQLNVTLKTAWSKFRAEWPDKKMGPFVAVPFKDWLIKDEPAPDAEALLQWAVLSNRIQLGDLDG